MWITSSFFPLLFMILLIVCIRIWLKLHKLWMDFSLSGQLLKQNVIIIIHVLTLIIKFGVRFQQKRNCTLQPMLTLCNLTIILLQKEQFVFLILIGFWENPLKSFSCILQDSCFLIRFIIHMNLSYL